MSHDQFYAALFLTVKQGATIGRSDLCQEQKATDGGFVKFSKNPTLPLHHQCEILSYQNLQYLAVTTFKKGLLAKFKVTLHANIPIPDSQQYH